MNVVIDANFIMATCAVFTLMLMIFGGFFSFVVMPVISKNTEAIKELGTQLKEKISDHDDILSEHNRRITDNSTKLAIVETKIVDHVEKG